MSHTSFLPPLLEVCLLLPHASASTKLAASIRYYWSFDCILLYISYTAIIKSHCLSYGEQHIGEVSLLVSLVPASFHYDEHDCSLQLPLGTPLMHRKLVEPNSILLNLYGENRFTKQ